jgi:predicted HicB family RNase H-like nuclease
MKGHLDIDNNECADDGEKRADRRLMVYLPAELYEQLAAAAAADERSLSAYVRRLISDAVT